MIHASYEALPIARKQVYQATYRMGFADDGCPMKEIAGEQVFHPLLPPYLALDFLNLYWAGHGPAHLAAAQELMRLAELRGAWHGGALLFVYRPESGLSAIPTDFYSSLAQSWYIRVLGHLEDAAPGKYRDLLKGAYASLLIPIEEGGVLVQREFGWTVEEYPHSPPLYTLNGWLTALRQICHVGPVLSRIGVDYMGFVDHNLAAVEHLLPLYDARFCWNTRYQLSGFSRIKIVTDRPAGLSCDSFSIEIPGEGVFPGLAAGGHSRWHNHVERIRERDVLLNTVLSLVSKPNPNVLRARLTVTRNCSATIMLADGDYSPHYTAMPTERWHELARVDLQPGAGRDLSFPIPFDGRDMFAYPTNFKKRSAGKLYNAYHFLHVIDLAHLYRFTKREFLAETARKWLEYPSHWPELSELSDPNLSFESLKYGSKLNQSVHKLLE